MTLAKNHYDIILSPLISEKMMNISSQNKIGFRVRAGVTKADIKAAVEHIFKVKVEKVNTLNRQGKSKMFRGTKGKTANRKIAVVTLAENSKIDIAAGV